MRTWWPVLRCLFSSRFERYIIQNTTIDAYYGELKLDLVCHALGEKVDGSGLASDQLFKNLRSPALKGESPCELGKFCAEKGLCVAEFCIVIAPNAHMRGERRLQVGVLLFEDVRGEQGAVWSWDAEHFLIAPGLQGAGLGERAIRRFIEEAKKLKAPVRLAVTSTRTGAPNAMPIETFLSLYWPHGFQTEPGPGAEEDARVRMRLEVNVPNHSRVTPDDESTLETPLPTRP
jgi:GNAT superfamily N-acetyltransferase